MISGAMSEATPQGRKERAPSLPPFPSSYSLCELSCQRWKTRLRLSCPSFPPSFSFFGNDTHRCEGWEGEGARFQHSTQSWNTDAHFQWQKDFFPDGSLEAIWRWHDCRIPSQALTQHPLRRGTRREGGLRSPPPPNDIGRPPPRPIQEPWIQANGVLGGEAESRISSTYPGQGIHPHPHPQSSPPSRDRNIFATASKTRKKRRRSHLVLFSTCLSIPASDQGSSLQTWRYRRSSERRQEFVYNIYRGDNLLYTGLWQNMYVFTRLYLQIMSDSGIAQVGLRGCNVKKWSKLWLLNIIIMTTIYVLQHKYHELQCISHSFLFLCRQGRKAICSYTTYTSLATAFLFFSFSPSCPFETIHTARLNRELN